MRRIHLSDLMLIVFAVFESELAGRIGGTGWCRVEEPPAAASLFPDMRKWLEFYPNAEKARLF